MTTHPIIFTGESVRAILAGRKTQTRRLMKPQPVEDTESRWPGWKFPSAKARSMVTLAEAACLGPYGGRGDTLWVRETWAGRVDIDGAADPAKARHYVMYRADSAADPSDLNNWHDYGGRWRSPRYMPRWASRITLLVTSVRVERVQEITEDDAEAEGVDEMDGMVDDAAICRAAKAAGVMVESRAAQFGALWDSINGKRAPWSANPWVWVIGFEIDTSTARAVTAEESDRSQVADVSDSK